MKKSSIPSAWIMPEPEFEFLIKRNATRVDRRTVAWEPKGKCNGRFHEASIYVVELVQFLTFPKDKEEQQISSVHFSYYIRYKDQVWRADSAKQTAKLLKQLRKRLSRK